MTEIIDTKLNQWEIEFNEEFANTVIANIVTEVHEQYGEQTYNTVVSALGSDSHFAITVGTQLSMEFNGISNIIHPDKNWVGSKFYSDTLHHVAEYLWNEAQKKDKNKFAFIMNSEGYTYADMKFWSDVFVDIQHNHLLRTNTGLHFVQIYACAPNSINFRFLQEHNRKYNLLNGMSIVCGSFLETMSHSEYIYGSEESKEKLKKLNSRPKIKPYKFLFYNNHVKLNRSYMVGQIIRRGLHPYGLMSLNLGHGGSTCYDVEDELRNPYQTYIEDHLNKDHPQSDLLKHFFPETGKEIFEALFNNKDVLFNLKPLGKARWSKENKESGTWCSYMTVGEDMYEHCEKCYFGIITETKYFHDITNRDTPDLIPMLKDLKYEYPITPDTNFLDSVTFTEKTSKFILAKMPFILMAFPRSLEVLRQQGYKTFSPYINEAYDSIINDEDRAVAVAEEITRLCNLTDEHWIEILENLIPRLEHNFKLMTSIDPFHTLRFHIQQ